MSRSVLTWTLASVARCLALHLGMNVAVTGWHQRDLQRAWCSEGAAVAILAIIIFWWSRMRCLGQHAWHHAAPELLQGLPRARAQKRLAERVSLWQLQRLEGSPGLQGLHRHKALPLNPCLLLLGVCCIWGLVQGGHSQAAGMEVLSQPLALSPVVALDSEAPWRQSTERLAREHRIALQECGLW
jgi:hypothetical protein